MKDLILKSQPAVPALISLLHEKDKSGMTLNIKELMLMYAIEDAIYQWIKIYEEDY